MRYYLKYIQFWRYDWNGILRLFLKFFLATFPFQLQSLLYKSNYLTGLSNSFVSFYFNFSEFVVLGIFLSYVFVLFKSNHQLSSSFSGLKKFQKLFFILFSVILLLDLYSIFQAKDYFLTWLFVLKDLEIFALFWIFSEGILSFKEIVFYLVLGAIFQSVIAIGQFFAQSSLGLGFLGEQVLSPEILNIAKLNIGAEKLIRAYGTFGHANILGAYLFLVISAVGILIKPRQWKYWPLIIVLLLALLVSFSRSAWLAIMIFGLFYFSKEIKKINWKYWLLGVMGIFFLIFLFNWQGLIWSRLTNFFDQSWQERMVFWKTAEQMVLHFPWGVGRGNFILLMGNTVEVWLSPWLFQPVHNVPMLLLAELGWLVLVPILALGIAVLFSVRNEPKFFGFASGVLILLFSDHLLITSFSGMIILMLAGVLMLSGLNKEVAIAH